METKREKLREQRGASMLLALLLLLVCAMVSAVILSASLTGVKRVRDDYDFEQSYLTVSSAASLLRDAVGEDTMHILVTRYTEEGTEDVAYLGDGKLHGLVAESVKHVYLYNDKYTRSFTVNAEGFSEVDVEMTMYENYDITLVLWERSDSRSAHRMTLTLNCERTVNHHDGDVDGVATEWTETLFRWS